MLKTLGAIFIIVGMLLFIGPKLIWLKESKERTKESEDFDSAMVMGRFLGIILVILGIVLVY